MAQLHGQEEEAYIRQLQDERGKKVIKAFSVRNRRRYAKAKASIADYILLDQGGGGTGKTFDWMLAGGHFRERPYFLAGGLSA